MSGEAPPPSRTVLEIGDHLPAEILERLTALRSEIGEVVYRTHPARLRLLELRARATERFLSSPDADPGQIEARLRFLASDWWRAAADIAQPAGSPRLAIPGSATHAFSPVVPSLHLVAVGAESVTVRFGIELGGGDAWTGPALTVKTQIEEETWRARDALPQGPIPSPAPGGGAWERLVSLECDRDLLRRQAVIPLKVRFEVKPTDFAVPGMRCVLDRRVGDASVFDWHVGGPVFGAAAAELLAEAMGGAPFQKAATEEGSARRWRQVRGAAPGRLDADPFLVDLPGSTASADPDDAIAVAVAAIEVRQEEGAELEILATGQADAWLGDRPLALHAERLPDNSGILLNRWRVALRFAPGRTSLIVRCSAPPGASVPWRMGARVRDAAGDPVLRLLPESPLSSAAGSPERSRP